MKFTEYEMTAAVAAVGQHSFEALPKLVRKRSGAASWHELKKGARYPYLRAAGDLVIPALAALPERPTVGASPEFSAAEYAQAAEAAMQARDAEAWDQLPEKKRAKLRSQVEQVVRLAVLAIPHRQDPDAFIVPDHL